MTAIRPLTEPDYPAYIAIYNRVWPNKPLSVSELRYGEETWDSSRYFKQRLMAVNETGQPVGFGSVRHMPEQFHPDKYALTMFVDPKSRGQGHGSALYAVLIELLRQRRAITTRVWGVKESDENSIRFATSRSFIEARRVWQSKLDVDSFDSVRFAGAQERVANQGITITTLAAETRIRPNLWQEMYELDSICARDVPDLDPFTPMPFDDFVKEYITAPYVLPDAFFLARTQGATRDRYVGVARLWTSEGEPDILQQDLTGVIPAYRGKGIAMALKLKTIEYARANGKRHISTWNDTLNQPMLRINEALGFIKEPAEITFVKDLNASKSTANTGETEGATR